jgi:dTDP-4-dehydrorhamnose 3,5-epimerase
VTFEPMSIPGAFRVKSPGSQDERGWFERVYCIDEFRGHGIADPVVQTSLSYNRRRGTLRGLHWQAPPDAEGKLVRCLRGRLYDVLADVRPDSPTRGRWESVELAEDDGRAVWIPPGVAHGFETLSDDTLVLYHMSARHSPALSRRTRWNDARLGIRWPEPPRVMSDEDRAAPEGGW